MKLAGFSLKKISAEKTNPVSNDLKLSANIDLVEIKKIKSNLFKSKEELVEVSFKYSINYTPDIAKIEIEGTVLLSLDSKQSKEILKSWASKELSEEFKISLFNLIIRKSSVKAFQLEEDLNLPLHMPLQRLKKQE